MADYLDKIALAVQNGDEKAVAAGVDAGLRSGLSAADILNQGLIPGIRALGQLFKDGEAYLPEIMISTRAMKTGVDRLRPLLAGESIQRRGVVVLGTVEGDMHDIGKNLVRLMLDSNGFEVHDLGVDVSAESFARAAQEVKADIVAISALLTTTMICMPDVVKALEAANVRDNVRIMIGGAPVTRAYADEIGVEGYADDCASAVDEADRLIKLAKGA